MRLVALAVALVLVAAHGTAAAYPEFQFSTGTARCSACHYSPVGGGLINDYGRDEAATTISGAGDGRFLHGAVEPPAWFALGGDIRVATLGKRVREGTEAAVFPMQVDLYARLARGGLSANATVGVLEAIREPAPLSERIGSREHYVLYEAEAKTWYARAGRFYPTFGLRLPDHTAYVRRFTGLHSLEESYAISGGLVRDRWEVHATLVTPLEVHPRVGRHGWGAAVQLERLTGEETGSWAIQAKTQQNDGALETWFGGTWKRWLESSDLLFAVEANAGITRIDGIPLIGRAVAYGTVHYRPGKRWGIALGAHYFDADLRLVDNDRVAAETRFAWFPRAHFEISALVRGSTVARELGRGDLLGMLQLHYYL
ncbi:MAG: hypothetical protein H0T46_13245 [Deltaproteobacteria bacterium]|nr:hypothetical protein [Deltaproteobacteria bacterium]